MHVTESLASYSSVSQGLAGWETTDQKVMEE